MARIDYHGIGVEIKNALVNDATLAAMTPVPQINDPGRFPTFDPQGNPNAVYIYLETRSAPENMQRLRAGQSTDMLIRFSIWSFSFHFDELPTAEQNRDLLCSNVELALMANRGLGGKVKTSWLEGGKFYGGDEGGFWSGCETILVCHAQAVTV